MEIKHLILGIVALTLLISVVQSLQIKSLKNQITTNAVQAGGIDMTGWTEDEKMQYEHHGTLPARLQKNTQQQAMVGGC